MTSMNGILQDQLRLILSLLGKPKPDDVEFVDKPRYKEMLLKMQEKVHIMRE